MKCFACGAALRPAAKYCGRCGAHIGESTVQPSTPVKLDQGLAGALQQLVAELNRAGRFSPAMIRAARALTVPPRDERHVTVVLGEQRRGKTTLMNRLLRRTLLPAGRSGPPLTYCLRSSESWQIICPDGEIIPIPEGTVLTTAVLGDRAVIEGAADILKHTTLIEPPALNAFEAADEEQTLEEALAADAVIFCIAAYQLLSETEQRTLREVLLPFTSCPILLVVTHLDVVESEDDRAELVDRVRRFTQRMPAGRIDVVFVEFDKTPGAPVPTVEDWLTAAATVHRIDRQTAWNSRIELLLLALEPSLSNEVEQGVHTASDWEADCIQAADLLSQEHVLAIKEASAFIQTRLAELRHALPPRFAGSAVKQIQHERLAELASEVQAISREAARRYLTALQRSLCEYGPSELAAPLQTLEPEAIGGSLSRVGVPHSIRRARRPRDWRVMSASGASIALMVFSGGWLPLAAGTLALVGANHLRKVRQAAFDEQLRNDAVLAATRWLDELEPILIERLKEETDRVRAELQRHLDESALPEDAPAPTALSADSLTEIWQRCLDTVRNAAPHD